jgi:excisionase family DNA binding protein
MTDSFPAAEPRNRAARRHHGGLLDFDGAADFLGVTPRAIRRLWQERRVAGVKVGRAVRFAEADLLVYIARQRVEAVR